jgi:hypothetical protein
MPFDALLEFTRLVDQFPRLCEAADLLEGLPPEHDANVVRLAIIGYSFHCNTGTWTEDDSALVRDCRANMPVVAFSPAWISFACLVTGYMIGVRRSGIASDLEALHGESILPGFMIRHRGRIEGLYMATQIKPTLSRPAAPAQPAQPTSQVTVHSPALFSARRTPAVPRPTA